MNIELTHTRDEALKLDLFELDFYTSENDLIFTVKGTFSVGIIYGKGVTTHVDLDHFQITHVEKEDEQFPPMLVNESYICESLKSTSEVQGMIEDEENRIGIAQGESYSESQTYLSNRL